MKRIVVVMLMVCVAMMCVTMPCEAKSKVDKNQKIAIKYCHKYCKGYKVKVVNYGNVPVKRTDKNVVYIEKIKTKSLGGKTGKTKDGYKVRYIKPVKKNRTEIVYCIYNPKNNACDDIICFVANKKMRADKKVIKPNCKKKEAVKSPVSVDCDLCHGKVDGCAYWYSDGNTGSSERIHMTKEQREEFERMEMDR